MNLTEYFKKVNQKMIEVLPQYMKGVQHIENFTVSVEAGYPHTKIKFYRDEDMLIFIEIVLDSNNEAFHVTTYAKDKANIPIPVALDPQLIVRTQEAAKFVAESFSGTDSVNEEE